MRMYPLLMMCIKGYIVYMMKSEIYNINYKEKPLKHIKPLSI